MKESKNSPNKKLNLAKGCSSLPLRPSEPYKLPPYIATEKKKVVSYQSQFVPSLKIANYKQKRKSFRTQVNSYLVWNGYEMTWVRND